MGTSKREGVEPRWCTVQCVCGPYPRALQLGGRLHVLHLRVVAGCIVYCVSCIETNQLWFRASVSVHIRARTECNDNARRRGARVVGLGHAPWRSTLARGGRRAPRGLVSAPPSRGSGSSTREGREGESEEGSDRMPASQVTRTCGVCGPPARACEGAAGERGTASKGETETH